MKLVKKEEAKIFKNSVACTAIEYPLGDAAVNGAVIELSGRYPDKGRVANGLCKELFYVIKGSGRVSVEGVNFEVREGDMGLINPGERFFWEGNMALVMPCVPAWNREQYKEAE